MTTIKRPWTAEDEYKKNPELKKKEIQELKQWTLDHNRIPNSVTDEQLILFHHSCYFNMEATKKCIEYYYDLKISTPAFFDNRDPDSKELSDILKVLHYAILPKPDPNGYIIAFHNLLDTEPSKYVFNVAVKALIMLMDVIYINGGTNDGMMLLFDMKGIKLGHLTRLPLLTLRKFFQYIQEANPVRLKVIRVLNVHPLIDKIMLIIKPFMKKELLDILHFHKENDPELEKLLPKSCLPKDFGGNLEPVQYYHEKFIEELRRLKPLFLEEDEVMYGPKTNGTKKSSNGYQSRINGMEID